MYCQRYGSSQYDTNHYSERLSEHYSKIRNYTAICTSYNGEYNLESDPESQLRCQYRTSHTRLIFGRATIFKEGDDNAGFATPLTTYNYHTGRAGTKHHEMHSPIEMASSGKGTWRRSNSCTPPTEESARREVIANTPIDESKSCISKLQFRMRSRLSLGNPNSVSSIPRYAAASGNQLQNQV